MNETYYDSATGNTYIHQSDGSWKLVSSPQRSTGLMDLASNYATNQATNYLFDAGGVFNPVSDIYASGGIAQNATDLAAWNSGADSATAAAGPGLASYAGAAAGAYGLYNLSQSSNYGYGRNILQGAASGAAIGSALPVIGTVPGAIIGATLGLGKSLTGMGGHTTHWEEMARAKLANQGINVPNAGVKEWENNAKFKESRNLADLKPEELIHAAQFYEEVPGYATASDKAQTAIAKEALTRGLLNEEHGGIDIKDGASLADFARNQYKLHPYEVAPSAPVNPYMDITNVVDYGDPVGLASIKPKKGDVSRG